MTAKPAVWVRPFIDRVLAHHRTPADREHVAARRDIFEALGLDPAIPHVMAGGQPLFLGGTPKVLGKLIALALIRKMAPACRTVYYLAGNDVARSDREFYRCLLPLKRGDRRIGLSTREVAHGWRAAAVPVTPTSMKRVVSELAAFFGDADVPEVLVRDLSQANRMMLADLNTRTLKGMSHLLGIEPDHWLDEEMMEDLVVRSVIWHDLLRDWPAFVREYNRAVVRPCKPIAPDMSPTWVHGDGPDRVALRLQGGYLVGPGIHAQVRSFFATDAGLHLHASLRATSRILALSSLFDAQISGSGSRYNIALERASETMHARTMPRLALPNSIFEYGPDTPSERRERNEYGTPDLLRYHSPSMIRARISSVLQGENQAGDRPRLRFFAL